MPSNSRPLEEKIAWVTGSSRGLGRVMAFQLAAMGARVAIHGTREDSPRSFQEGESMHQVAHDIKTATKSETLATWGDLTIPKEVDRIAAQIKSQWREIDILVCAAGGDIGAGGTDAGRGGRPENDDALGISIDDIGWVMDRNLLTAILCCKAVSPDMMAQKSGRIITIGSIAGCFGRTDGVIYSVAKAGLHEYTRCLALQLRPYNIPVNCVAPGGTVTERFKAIHDLDETMMTEAGTLERYGRPPEVASVVGFLASEMGRFVNGQVIRVDGGSQCWPC